MTRSWSHSILDEMVDRRKLYLRTTLCYSVGTKIRVRRLAAKLTGMHSADDSFPTRLENSRRPCAGIIVANGRANCDSQDGSIMIIFLASYACWLDLRRQLRVLQRMIRVELKFPAFLCLWAEQAHNLENRANRPSAAKDHNRRICLWAE